MITKLTKQQEAKFPEYVAKWVDIGTSTEPTDMIATVDAIKRAYEVVKLNPPKYFIGPVAGPYEAALAEALIEFHANNNTKFANARELNERIMREIEEYICSRVLSSVFLIRFMVIRNIGCLIMITFRMNVELILMCSSLSWISAEFVVGGLLLKK